jgi:hypothetical protein
MRLIPLKGKTMDPTTGLGPPPGAPERSTSELVKLVSEQLSTLVRDEIKERTQQ